MRFFERFGAVPHTIPRNRGVREWRKRPARGAREGGRKP